MLQHSLAATSRLLLTGKTGPQQCQGGLELQLGGCALQASVGLESHDRLQGSVLLQNNCTTLQVIHCSDSCLPIWHGVELSAIFTHWLQWIVFWCREISNKFVVYVFDSQDMGTPSRMEASGFLIIDKKLVDSHLSLLTDEPKLQAHLTQKKARVRMLSHQAQHCRNLLTCI